MEKKKFDPRQWLDTPIAPVQQPDVRPCRDVRPYLSTGSRVEAVINLIEQNQKDITSIYSEWCNIGFAFAGEFGEQGRDLFHRVSRFHPDYSQDGCNQQFDKCLKGKRGLVTIKTFFFYAKNAGLILNQEGLQKENNDEPIYVPNMQYHHYHHYPNYLQKVVKVATFDEERDLILLGALGAISSCLPNLYGIYDGRKVFANLYLFVTAPASAGKGRLVHCRQLVAPVHQELRRQARLIRREFEMALIEYNLKKGTNETMQKPEKPAEKMLFIPANNSSTGAYQLLGDSDGRGLIFETEGDTLANSFKTDYGNYSDGFRKAFHHETISYYRRMDREYVDIPSPCLSAVLSGTPKQVGTLIPNAENGLFSRFIFYYMNFRPEWRNVFAENIENSLEEYFEGLGKEFYELYKQLKNGPQRLFCLNADQEERFNAYFTKAQDHFIGLLGINYIATIRRLGLITFRICMIFSALRILENNNHDSVIHCSEEDFQSALDMTTILNQHSVKIFSEIIPQEEETTTQPRYNRTQAFLDSLPENFSRKQYLEVATTLKIPERTADFMVKDFIKKHMVKHVQRDHYKKVLFECNPK